MIGRLDETGGSHDTSLMGRPSEVWVDPADGGSHVINVTRRGDMEVVSDFGAPGVATGQLGRPHNITVDPSGNIFVGEAQGPKVKHPVNGAEVEAGFRARKFTLTGVRQ